MINIVAVGDIMPGGLLNQKNQPCANSEVLDFLMQGDIRCGTLECALGNEATYDQKKVADRGNVIYAKDDDIRRLKELHIDIVSLSNNHFFDLGLSGAVHTIELLDTEGIKHCGAGVNIKEAGKPVVIEIKNKTVAFLAFCDTDYKNVYYCTYATENSPGVNPMEKDYVINEIKKNATQYDYVVVFAHWGREHTFMPNVAIEKMARKMLKAGACLVLGSHPHRVQPVMNTPNGSIAFSMGNFLFPERLIAPPKITYYPDEQIDYSTLPITDKYPTVDRVTLKTLPYLARVGMIVKAQIDQNKVVCDYLFSYLKEDNSLIILSKKESEKIEKELQWIQCMINNRLYQVYWFASRIFKYTIGKLKRFLRK